MGTIGWVVVGVTAWTVLSVPVALLVGALLRAGARRPVARRAASGRARARYAAPCVGARRVPAV